MTEHHSCPGCGRHCDLSSPACERGAEYARAGAPAREEGARGTRRPQYHTASVNDKLVLNFRDIGHMMRRQYEGKASQKRILIILNESPALTQKELTERLGIQPGSASEILSKLEDTGLIVRTPNETDRRTIDLQLTEEGRALAVEAAQQRRKRHEAMFACLSEEERQTLLLLLERICEDWESRFFSPDAHDHRGKHEQHPGGHHRGRPRHGA